MVEYLLTHWQRVAWDGVVLIGTGALALLCHYILYGMLERLARRTPNTADESLVRYSKKPARLIFPLVAFILVLPGLGLSANVFGAVRHAIGIALIAAVAWVVVALFDVLEDVLKAKYRIDVADNYNARRIQTQVQVLRRIGVVVVTVVALAAVLMTFPTIWNVGAGLFASAGVAGLVIGMAARPTLSNLLAGMQIALTEPIRIEDVVIIEGEWGWIEEISTTYVVVRIWDLRRMVVPLTYFIEKPFQNWTRRSADILGTVFIYTDYSVPVNEIRLRLHDILQASGMWDGKAWGLQVTNADQRTMELRALMSAPNSGVAWDLRCHVRERLIEFLQTNYPASLPRVRADVDGAALAARLEKGSGRTESA